MNKTILDIIKQYPIDGTHGYHWVNGFDGCTEDIHYEGRLIMKANDLKQTYCCGLTFETFLKAAFKKGLKLGSAQDVITMKRHWFCATGKHEKATDYKGPVDALVPIGLATEVTRQEAKAGDYAQIWRKSGSGHSVVLTDIIITNVDYWSTQPSTNGIGYRKEFFEEVNNPITHIYIARVQLPK